MIFGRPLLCRSSGKKSANVCIFPWLSAVAAAAQAWTFAQMMAVSVADCGCVAVDVVGSVEA